MEYKETGNQEGVLLKETVVLEWSAPARLLCHETGQILLEKDD